MKLDDLEEKLAAPALRALKSVGIEKIEDLKKHTRAEIEELHGIGKNALIILDNVLIKINANYANEKENEEVSVYINEFKDDQKERLMKVRKVIRKTIPMAKEKMAYGMPTYYYKENVVHFAGFQNHIAIFPTPSGIEAFKSKIEKYKNSKGAVQFPNDKEFPYELIKEIVEYRINEINHK